MSRIWRSTRLGRNFSNRAWVILRWPRYHQRVSSSAYIASYSCGSKVCPLVCFRIGSDGDALLLRRRVLALLLSQEDKAHVPAADACHGAEDALRLEELRRAVRAGEVRHRQLRHARTGVLEAAHELNADGAIGGLEGNIAQGFAPQQAEVAVDIADGQREGDVGYALIDTADEDAVPGVLTAALVAVYYIDAGLHRLGQEDDLAGVILTVAVRVEDVVTRGRFEAADQGSAVAPVDGMFHDAEGRYFGLGGA